MLKRKFMNSIAIAINNSTIQELTSWVLPLHQVLRCYMCLIEIVAWALLKVVVVHHIVHSCQNEEAGFNIIFIVDFPKTYVSNFIWCLCFLNFNIIPNWICWARFCMCFYAFVVTHIIMCIIWSTSYWIIRSNF